MEQTGGKGSILPLRASDLVFNRKSDGIMSCGYKVSNALLNSTLNVQYGGGQQNKEKKTRVNSNVFQKYFSLLLWKIKQKINLKKK